MSATPKLTPTKNAADAHWLRRLVRFFVPRRRNMFEQTSPGLVRLLDVSRSIDARMEWEDGTLRGTLARRHRKTGECQFVLWKAGEQGHATDHWIRFDASWWPQFKPNSD